MGCTLLDTLDECRDREDLFDFIEVLVELKY